MTFAEAIAAIAEGKRVMARCSEYWLEHDSKGRPVLMVRPTGFDHPVKHAVFSSEHFNPDLKWEMIE